MNQTVTRIVEIMFQDYEMSDEVRTIHDEVLSNCQERFADCVNRGLTEDEAIAAVLESLKGMEAVLQDYPKKTDHMGSRSAAASSDNGWSDSMTGFDYRDIKQVNASLTYEDLLIEEADDSRFDLDLQNCPHVKPRIEDGTLYLIHEQMKTDSKTDRKDLEARMDAAIKDAQNQWKSGEMTMGRMLNSIGSLIGNVGRVVKDQIAEAVETSVDGAGIVLRVPAGHAIALQAKTTSGDVKVKHGVTLTACSCESMSGDVDVDALGYQLPEISARSTSGDVTVRAHAGQATVSSVSGDASLAGKFTDIRLNTVSGDISLEDITFEHAALKTVSGDADIAPESCSHTKVNFTTTSGDMDLLLPSRGLTVHATLKSVSGDVKNGYADAGDYSDVVINAQSVSGDITIH